MKRVVQGELVRIPAEVPAGQMAWIEERARLGALEIQIRVRAMGLRNARDPGRAIFELVRDLPNFQYPGGWWTHTQASESLIVGGSCADKTILVGALANACGIRWRAVWVKAPDELGADRDHVAPQLCNEKGCWWADPSWTRAAYGESPVLLIEKNLGQDHRNGSSARARSRAVG